MAAQRVVIVGAGVGGLVTAQRLAGAADGYEVTLVDRELRHTFAPSFLWVMTGARTPSSVTRSLERLRRAGVRLERAEVEGIELERRLLATSAGELPWDELVLAPGAELAPESVPGLAEGSQLFYTLEDAVRLRDALRAFHGGRVLVVVASMPFRCPAAPYEAAFLIDDLLRRRGISARVDVVTAEPQPFPVLGSRVGDQVRALLAARGIGFSPGHSLAEVAPDAREARFADGSSEPYDLLVAIPPHRPPGFLAASPLAGPQGWAPVDHETLEAVPGVHVIGDAAAIPLAHGMMLPKAGVFAHAQAETVARNLIAAARGKPPEARFDGHGTCFLETGGGRAGFASGNFYAAPEPSVRLHPPARRWYWGKVLFERRWLLRLRG